MLSASSVTNTGATVLNGNLGLFPGTSITGAGTIALTGATFNDDAAAQQAEIDATNAFHILMALPSTDNLTGQNLGGLTLTPGVYEFSSSAQLTGALTLNFEGESDKDIVIQIGSTLTTAAGATVKVENGNSTDGVFYEVGSSATLGAGTVFAGNILASASITLGSAAEDLCGRTIALTGAVTMIGNTISNNCFGAGAEGSGISDFSSVGFSGGDFISAGYTGGGFNGVPPAVAITPTPTTEPASLALFGFGLIGVSGAVRRRRKSAQAPAIAKL